MNAKGYLGRAYSVNGEAADIDCWLDAAAATVIGQGVTVVIALTYIFWNKKFFIYIPLEHIKKVSSRIFKVGLAPFGLALTPNISLVLINRFSAFYGGEKAIATYACVSYIICIIYLILQGVGDGSQPLMSQYRDFIWCISNG